MAVDAITPAYDAWAKTYDADVNELIPVEQMVVRSLLRTIECHSVLDAATGTGRYAFFVAERGNHVIGIDQSDGMLAQAIEKKRQTGLPVQFMRGKLARLPLPDNAFDLVICALAMSHNPDLSEPCRELVRVARQGGSLVVSDLHPHFQKTYGADYQIEIAGKPYAYPLFHYAVDDYTDALKAAGAAVLAALDVPTQFRAPSGERVTEPGALVIWAKKSI